MLHHTLTLLLALSTVAVARIQQARHIGLSPRSAEDVCGASANDCGDGYCCPSIQSCAISADGSTCCEDWSFLTGDLAQPMTVPAYPFISGDGGSPSSEFTSLDEFSTDAFSTDAFSTDAVFTSIDDFSTDFPATETGSVASLSTEDVTGTALVVPTSTGATATTGASTGGVAAKSSTGPTTAAAVTTSSNGAAATGLSDKKNVAWAVALGLAAL